MKQLLGLTIVMLIGMLGAEPAVAGGWAVSTLDAVPVPSAGEVVQVGFTIRQHGVSPLNPDGEVGIVVRSTGGSEQYFPAEPVGEIGHHVAPVVFPEEGTFTWAVRQGWFAEQDLGSITVGPSTAGSSVAPTGAAIYRWPWWLRAGLPVLSVALLAFAAIDLIQSRARHRRRREAVLA